MSTWWLHFDFDPFGLKAQATTMDFRQVEKKFRLAALLIQVVLCSFLLCFLGFSFKQILDSSADPPVETTTVQWRKGLGLWALCGLSSGSLFGVGTASESEVWGYHDREKALAGAQLSEPEIMNFSLSLSLPIQHTLKLLTVPSWIWQLSRSRSPFCSRCASIRMLETFSCWKYEISGST